MDLDRATEWLLWLQGIEDVWKIRAYKCQMDELYSGGSKGGMWVGGLKDPYC